MFLASLAEKVFFHVFYIYSFPVRQTGSASEQTIPDSVKLFALRINCWPSRLRRRTVTPRRKNGDTVLMSAELKDLVCAVVVGRTLSRSCQWSRDEGCGSIEAK